jgi:subtilase family serine protease
MDSDVPDSDLKTFWKAAKINRTGKLRRIPVDGYPGINADGGETALDVEMSSGLAPAADVDLYLIADLSDPSVEDGYNLILNQHAVQVVSSSFGDCELDDLPLAIATENLALKASPKASPSWPRAAISADIAETSRRTARCTTRPIRCSIRRRIRRP